MAANSSRPEFVRVAVPVPLYRHFDYRWPLAQPAEPGQRVRVPFGRRTLIGFVVATGVQPRLAAKDIKAVHDVLDQAPVLPAELRELVHWTADYYQHPLGEAYATALPVLLRQGDDPVARGEPVWRRLPHADAEALMARAPLQRAVYQRLRDLDVAVAAPMLRDLGGSWRQAADALVEKGLATVEESRVDGCLPGLGQTTPPPLNEAQREASEAIEAGLGGFAAYLLQGVTGSGKTEVYLHAVAASLAQGRQSLVIVPEIGLTPQLVSRFQHRLHGRIAVMHSHLTDRERLDAWVAARDGQADVIIGTRSAIFTPLPRPGLIVVDEEHDSSLKQQDGLRYSARDLAVMRASKLAVPVVLGSATPSLESLANAGRERYRLLRLPARAGAAKPPRFRVLDIRSSKLDGGLSRPLIELMREHLAAEGQVLLFLNRRGFAPVILCHDCGWLAECPRCDARMTYHQSSRRLLCHHCGHGAPLPRQCPGCGSGELRAIGQGTERLEEALAHHFPGETLLRIDRDSTRRKGSMEAMLDQARRGEARILLGTQMLAKGHDLPNITLVGVIDADQGLFSSDFRAPERMAQTLIQVAGRAGRADRAGEVALQTHHPLNPQLVRLIKEGYEGFAASALAEREQIGWPPFGHLALLRAEAASPNEARRFLAAALAQAGPADGVTLAGPVPAPMEKRAGLYRFQLMVLSPSRQQLHGFLRPWTPALAELPLARKVRWSVDVDPQDTF